MFLFLLIFITFFSFYYYFSYQVILLNDIEEIFSQTAKKAQNDFDGRVELVLEDLSNTYSKILIIIAVAAIATFLWILLLKYNAKLIIWLSVFSLPVILSIGAFYSIRTYINLHKGNGLDGEDLLSSEEDQPQNLSFDKALQTILTAELLSYVRNETLWLVLSIILCIILTASVIILHSLRSRVTLSIALIRQASKAINGVKSTLVFPIIPRAFGIAAIVYGIMISLLIIAASHPTYHYVGGPKHGKPCNPRNKTSTVIPAHRVGSLLSTSSSSSLQPQTPPNIPVVPQLPRSLALQSAFQPQLQASRPAQQPQQPFQQPVTVPPNIRGPDEATSIRFNGQVNNINPQPFNPGQPFPNSRVFVAAPPIISTNKNNVTLRPLASNLEITQLKPQCVLNQKLSRQHVWKYHAANLFATLWLIHFLSGISQTTLAGAFASYYWAFRKPRDVPFFAVSRSFWRVICHHLGDIAFGSFLIATIRYVRIVIEFIDNRIRRKNNPDVNNSTTRSVTCFFRIFFWLLDRFLKYIDRNAYIMMSMYGDGYLSSAKRAVELLYKNSTRAIVLDYVTYFILLVSRLLITGFAGYYTAQSAFTANLHFKWLPTVLVVLSTYFISKGLFSVYSMAVDTLFICFLIDSSNNDGTAERPYFMSKELRRIIKKNTVSYE